MAGHHCFVDYHFHAHVAVQLMQSISVGNPTTILLLLL